MKNNIKFDLKEVSEGQIMEIDGIIFSNIAYVLVFVDGVNLFTLDFFKGSFLVFKELKNSIAKSGKYLLFTSVAGIADMDYVEVVHKENSVTWNIQIEDTILSYIFDKSDYLTEISLITKKIEYLKSNIKLEPLYIIYLE